MVTDTADPADASSNIANVSAQLTALVSLTATAVSSSCTFDSDTGKVTGTASITGGSVGALVPISLAANPAPNTGVSVAGIADITLNKQVTAADGTLTVDAIYVSLLGSTQTLTIGESSCNAASLAPVPILPHDAISYGVAGLSVLLLGGVGFQISRRRRAAAAA